MGGSVICVSGRIDTIGGLVDPGKVGDREEGITTYSMIT
jgi:hypothetical protein